jgi:hypothetical protein
MDTYTCPLHNLPGSKEEPCAGCVEKAKLLDLRGITTDAPAVNPETHWTWEDIAKAWDGTLKKAIEPPPEED